MIKYGERLKNISNKTNLKIASIDEFKGFFSGSAGLSPRILGRLKKNVIITSTGASTRIEGSQMTDAEVEKLITNLKVSRLKDRDSQEVAGYAELVGNIFDNYGSIKFSESTILGFHKILLKYSEKDAHHRGRYKTSQNKVVARDGEGNESVIFKPVEPYMVPAEMQNLVEWTNKSLSGADYHPLLVIANFVVEFLYIHPFKDGNGRLSRAITNLLMLQKGYKYVMYDSHEKLIEDTKPGYYLALRKSQENIRKPACDISPWTEYFLEIMSGQAGNVRKLLEKEPVEKILSPRQLKTLDMFGAGNEITVMDVVTALKCARSTAKQVLKRLTELKLIELTGSGRSSRYIRK